MEEIDALNTKRLGKECRYDIALVSIFHGGGSSLSGYYSLFYSIVFLFVSAYLNIFTKYN